MAQSKRRQIRYKQRVKRKKTRKAIKKMGLNPNDFFVEGICLSLPKKGR